MTQPATTGTSPPQLLRLRDVLTRTGLARSTLYAMIQAGAFPKNVKLGARSSAWSSAEVDGWIAARIADRATVTAAAA